MGRTAQPWFDKQKNQWTVWFGGRRERLATGRKNKKAARQRLAELQLEAAKNPDIRHARPSNDRLAGAIATNEAAVQSQAEPFRRAFGLSRRHTSSTIGVMAD